MKQKETYISQFEMVAALVPFLSLPREWLRGYPVELWIDNSPAIFSLLKGYSGVADMARIINMFNFSVAKCELASLWIDYVPSESNPADEPSRAHEMPLEEVSMLKVKYGPRVPAVIPHFSDSQGEWLSYVSIAESVWT